MIIIESIESLSATHEAAVTVVIGELYNTTIQKVSYSHQSGQSFSQSELDHSHSHTNSNHQFCFFFDAILFFVLLTKSEQSTIKLSPAAKFIIFSLFFFFCGSIMSLEPAEKAIPALVRMFSGCEDKQTSADGTYFTVY